MLTLHVPGEEYFNEKTSQFVELDAVTLELEHSLVSLSKWESKWEKPFLGKDKKSSEEALSYIECMCLTPEIPTEVFARLSRENYETVNDYINAKMTATWFNDSVKPKASIETITSELIYYWMTVLNVPFECETWHLERLFTLIKVVNHKNTPVKKTGRADLYAQRRALNEKRRREQGTSG